jgi:hypothetical protein
MLDLVLKIVFVGPLHQIGHHGTVAPRMLAQEDAAPRCDFLSAR